MPTKIVITQDPAQIDGVLKLRHKVFSEEEGFFKPTTDGRVIDRFDTYNTTSNLVVLDENHVVGGLRLTIDSYMGVPADDYFDFRSHLPDEYTLLSCSMFCVTKPYRNPRIALSLLLMASYFGFSRNITHVIAPIHPPIERLLSRVGFEPLGGIITDPHSGLEILPMMMDASNIKDFFFTFAENNRLYNFLDSYSCIFYKKGEYIVHEGEQGYSVFVIVEGEVEVKSADSEKSIAIMGQGEVFGELALLTDDVRTADVIAHTDVRVMSLSKADFVDHLLKNPDHAMLMLKSIGGRMKSLMEKNKI